MTALTESVIGNNVLLYGLICSKITSLQSENALSINRFSKHNRYEMEVMAIAYTYICYVFSLSFVVV